MRIRSKQRQAAAGTPSSYALAWQVLAMRRMQQAAQRRRRELAALTRAV